MQKSQTQQQQQIKPVPFHIDYIISWVCDKHQQLEQWPYVNWVKLTHSSMKLFSIRNWLLSHTVICTFENNYISSQHGSLTFYIIEIFLQISKQKAPQNLCKTKASWPEELLWLTSKPINNHHKACDVSGKGELLHDRQIDIILEMVTALKTKFKLRKKISRNLFHK